MYCRNCKKEYPEGSRFCGSCGAPLVRMLDIYGERFYEGDMEAFNYIYADTYSWVLNEVRKIFAVNVSEIDDCVQEIYLLLYRKIRQYNPERGSFSAWFNTLVRNRIYDYGRKLARNKEFVPDEEEGYFSEMVDENIHINPEAKLERSERERIFCKTYQRISDGQLRNSDIGWSNWGFSLSAVDADAVFAAFSAQTEAAAGVVIRQRHGFKDEKSAHKPHAGKQLFPEVHFLHLVRLQRRIHSSNRSIQRRSLFSCRRCAPHQSCVLS
mgnify:CR=1 FL=1